MNIGNNIAALRKSKGLTQEQLAEKCGVSRQSVTKWETGESEPTIERLIILSDVFEVTVDEIIKGKRIDEIQFEGSQAENKIIYENVDIEFVFRRLEQICFALNCWKSTTDIDKNEKEKLYLLWNVYVAIKEKFIDSNGKIYDKYLVCNSTPKNRKEYVFKISGIGKYDFECKFDDYINGKCEIDEALEAIIKTINKHIEVDG